jgi:hypothetical protein
MDNQQQRCECTKLLTPIGLVFSANSAKAVLAERNKKICIFCTSAVNSP